MGPIFIVSPFLVHVFVRHEFRYFVVTGVWPWFAITLWQIFLTIKVDQMVAELLEHLDFSIRPPIEIDRFHFRNMNPKLSMNT